MRGIRPNDLSGSVLSIISVQTALIDFQSRLQDLALFHGDSWLQADLSSLDWQAIWDGMDVNQGTQGIVEEPLSLEAMAKIAMETASGARCLSNTGDITKP